MDSVTEEGKLAHTEAYNTHVLKARLEREFYNACKKSSADELNSHSHAHRTNTLHF